MHNEQGRKGKILLFDFTKPEKGVTALKMDRSFNEDDFFPHGISVLQDEDTGRCSACVYTVAWSHDLIASIVLFCDLHVA